jgi:cyanophycinase
MPIATPVDATFAPVVLPTVDQNTTSAREGIANTGAVTPSLEQLTRPRFLFGGGPPNAAALQEFWRAAGGSEARIVVIGWGSTVSDDYYQKLKDALTAAVGQAPESAELEPRIEMQKMPELSELDGDPETAIELLKNATAVFFLGGDQVRLMQALTVTGVGDVVRELIDAGHIVHAGTSAGTAIGSHAMIGGYVDSSTDLSSEMFTFISHSRTNSDGQTEDRSFFVGEGLALVPNNVVIEQHLSRDGRRERLQHAVKSLPGIEWGVGIDDSMAALWLGDGMIKAIGPTGVLIVRKTGGDVVEEVAWLQHGEVFDLAAGQVLQ